MLIEILKTFLMSGLIVTLISYIANKSVKIGAMLYAFPTQFVIAVGLICLQGGSGKLIVNLTEKSLYSVGGVIFFLFVLKKILKVRKLN